MKKKLTVLRLAFILLTSICILTPLAVRAKNCSIEMGAGRFAPGTLTRGQTYNISGKITSTHKLTSVTVGVYYPNGQVTGQTKTVNPNAYSYDISNLASYVKPSALQPGLYALRVIAKDSCGTVKPLVYSSFTVKEDYIWLPESMGQLYCDYDTSSDFAEGMGCNFEYDSQGKLTAYHVEGAGDCYHQFAYNSAGRPTECKLRGWNYPIQYTYDSGGNLIKIVETFPYGDYVTTATYDGNGNQLTLTRTKIANAGGYTTKKTFTYSSSGEIKSSTYTAGGETTAYTYQYTYDANGNVRKAVAKANDHYLEYSFEYVKFPASKWSIATQKFLKDLGYLF